MLLEFCVWLGVCSALCGAEFCMHAGCGGSSLSRGVRGPSRELLVGCWSSGDFFEARGSVRARGAVSGFQQILTRRFTDFGIAYEKHLRRVGISPRCMECLLSYCMHVDHV